MFIYMYILPVPSLSSGVTVKLSTSPFPELEEEHIGMELYSSWILSSWTKQLLSQQTAGQHLTCPALMADIRVVSFVKNIVQSLPTFMESSINHVHLDIITLHNYLISCFRVTKLVIY